MSDERSEPNYNLRSRRVRASGSPTPTSEGSIRASDLLRRNDEERGVDRCDSSTQDKQEEPTPTQELVPHLPPLCNDEGGSTGEAMLSSTPSESGTQRGDDSPREAQGQRLPSPHSPLVAEDSSHDRQEILRLRVRVIDKKIHRVTYQWIPINNLI